MSPESVYKKYPKNEASSLIAMLQDIQEIHGYLPEDDIIRVAKHAGVPTSRVFGVATFYNQFRLTPLGKHVIRVCRGTACHVKGSLDILQTLEAELGIKAGETTKDLLFTIETVACIGACSIAPVMVIDGKYYGGLTGKSVYKLINEYKSKE
ncbi:MAG: NADH-quinone oxidoreductase subunit NuoE [Candidatus Neomarinimicrobiota bacterium]|jgi:NADH-quinone oxidoreductase subunit E|nr:NADH-quinone oxidoreductase subunit NuoE [Candidatus Neomarinimicrobiota bacterium]MDD3965637.1 NADH-quinone oxidoreductase subunit NuoE [Candidatus Neomarinimicrobiota bacterium]MDX9779779.1 NADH-quinone oxidoreductase subunit NuoE [bacterium]